MASEVTICNLALGLLGDTGNVSSINPPENSVQADWCAHFYPMARDVVLESHNWNFATRRATLASVDVELWEWSYAYALPSSLLNVVAVLPAGSASTDESEDYALEKTETGVRILRTNLEDASLVYTVKETDPTRFPPMFVSALANLLASYLAGPVVRGEAGVQAERARYARFKADIETAKVNDARQGKVTAAHTVPWLSVRN